jgi:hypothetical protein
MQRDHRIAIESNDSVLHLHFTGFVWQVWLNSTGSDYSGISLSSDGDRELAVQQAIAVLTEATRKLRAHLGPVN